MNIDHEEWANLYKSDPAEFERRRRAEIATLIDSAPEERQHSMYALQREIDAYRGTHTPEEVMSFLMKRTQEKLLDLQDQLLDICTIVQSELVR